MVGEVVSPSTPRVVDRDGELGYDHAPCRPPHQAMVRFIFLLACAHFSHHVLAALLTPLLPFIRDEFSLNYAQSGFMVSAFTIAYGVSQIPAGWIADRFGARYLLLVGVSGVAIAGALVGLSTSYALLVVTLFLLGIAGGAYHPSASSLISGTVPAGSRGRVLGIHIIGGSASHFSAPLIAAGLVAAANWRGAFLALSVPVLLVGIMVFGFQQRRHPMQRTAEGSAASASGGRGTKESVKRDAETPQPTSHIVMFLFLAGFIGAVIGSVIAYVPLFLVDSHGVDARVSAAFLSILAAAGFFAAPLGGLLSDRLGPTRVMMGLALITGPLFLVTPWIPFGVLFGVLLLLFGAIVYVKMPTAEMFIAASVPERLRGTILGVYFFSSVEGSALLTPLLGAMIDRWGFERSLGITGWAVLVITASVVAFFLATKRQVSYSGTRRR